MNIIKRFLSGGLVPKNTEPNPILKRKITPDTVECVLDTDYLTKFLPIMQPGDELWFFDNEQWVSLSGRSGYCIVRDGAILHSEIWAMN